MKKLLPVITILFLFSLISCKRITIVGTGKSVTNLRTIQPFNAIDVSAPVDIVILVQENVPFSFQINGYQNLQDNIKSEVESNTLHIYTPEDIEINTDAKLKVFLRVPYLTALTLRGSSNAKIQGLIKGNKFELTVAGAGDVLVDNMNVAKFHNVLTGAGNVTIKGGTAQYASYKISGAGSVNAFLLHTTETLAQVSGAGESDVNVEKELNAHISGAGSIRYKGHPLVSSQTSGIGEVADANEE